YLDAGAAQVLERIARAAQESVEVRAGPSARRDDRRVEHAGRAAAGERNAEELRFVDELADGDWIDLGLGYDRLSSADRDRQHLEVFAGLMSVDVDAIAGGSISRLHHWRPFGIDGVADSVLKGAVAFARRKVLLLKNRELEVLDSGRMNELHRESRQSEHRNLFALCAVMLLDVLDDHAEVVGAYGRPRQENETCDENAPSNVRAPGWHIVGPSCLQRSNGSLNSCKSSGPHEVRSGRRGRTRKV